MPPPPVVSDRTKPKPGSKEPVYYEPFIFLFGAQKSISSAVNDAGTANVKTELTPGMSYNYSSGSMHFNGSESVHVNQSFTLGIAAKRSSDTTDSQTGFSTTVSFKTAQIDKDATLWEFLDANARITLSLRASDSVYTLQYQNTPRPLTLFIGPTAVAGVRVDLLVRCLPGMLLCTLIDLT